MKAKLRSNGPDRWLLILLLAPAPLMQTGCGYVAAGAAGAVVGHEIAEEEQEKEDEEN